MAYSFGIDLACWQDSMQWPVFRNERSDKEHTRVSSTKAWQVLLQKTTQLRTAKIKEMDNRQGLKYT